MDKPCPDSRTRQHDWKPVYPGVWACSWCGEEREGETPDPRDYEQVLEDLGDAEYHRLVDEGAARR